MGQPQVVRRANKGEGGGSQAHQQVVVGVKKSKGCGWQAQQQVVGRVQEDQSGRAQTYSRGIERPVGSAEPECRGRSGQRDGGGAGRLGRGAEGLAEGQSPDRVGRPATVGTVAANEDGPIAEGERLQKALARAGLGSRRVCENLIADERVTINGVTAILGARANTGDEIAVDGTVYSVHVDAVTYLLNKRRGVVTTAKDTHGRPTVIELVPDEPRVFPVGRLDLDTEGLLLLTNDGHLAHRLTHPSFGVEKEYLAHVRGRPSRAALRSLRDGIELDDGMTAPAKASVTAPGMVRITIHEGRNRQVRRMLEAVGHEVVRLVRTRIGPLSDPRLGPGQWRPLGTSELLALQRAVAVVDSPPRPAGGPQPGADPAETGDLEPGGDTGTEHGTPAQ